MLLDNTDQLFKEGPIKLRKRFALVDLDATMRSSSIPISILNDLPSETEDDRKAIDSLIMTTYDNTDILSSIPSCSCGYTTMGRNLGRLCIKCNTMVNRPVETPIMANVWLRVPEGVDGFIAPVTWTMLSKALSSSKYNIMEWLTNPLSRPPINCSKVSLEKISKFEMLGWERGLNNFIRNFDKFLEILPVLKIKDEKELIKWLTVNRANLFPKHLPMPTKSLLVLENTAVGSFADLPITGAVDAAKTIVSISKPGNNYSQVYLERKVVSVIKNLSTYLWTTICDSFNTKKGWIRGQLFRSRSHFCMRGVITSITEPHDYTQIHVPWAQGLELLKVHIVSKLIRRGYNVTDAFSLVEASGKVYVPILDEMMQELVGTGYALGVILQRNPTLTRASAQFFYIGKIKNNVEDQTLSFSILCVAGPNADFDKLTVAISSNANVKTF